jgi:hypothetical protein
MGAVEWSHAAARSFFFPKLDRAMRSKLAPASNRPLSCRTVRGCGDEGLNEPHRPRRIRTVCELRHAQFVAIVGAPFCEIGKLDGEGPPAALSQTDIPGRHGRDRQAFDVPPELPGNDEHASVGNAIERPSPRSGLEKKRDEKRQEAKKGKCDRE